MTLFILILLALMAIGTLPLHAYSRNWGFYPSGIIATIFVIVLLSILL